jgi:hypothetical protein
MMRIVRLLLHWFQHRYRVMRGRCSYTMSHLTVEQQAHLLLSAIFETYILLMQEQSHLLGECETTASQRTFFHNLALSLTHTGLITPLSHPLTADTLATVLWNIYQNVPIEEQIEVLTYAIQPITSRQDAHTNEPRGSLGRYQSVYADQTRSPNDKPVHGRVSEVSSTHRRERDRLSGTRAGRGVSRRYNPRAMHESGVSPRI